MQVDAQRLRMAIKGTGWAKFLAILYYVISVFYILGCVTIPFAIFTIIMGMKLWAAANKLEQLKYQDDPNVLYAALDDLGSFFTWSGIFVVVSIVLTILAFVVSMLMLFPNMSATYSL